MHNPYPENTDRIAPSMWHRLPACEPRSPRERIAVNLRHFRAQARMQSTQPQRRFHPAAAAPVHCRQHLVPPLARPALFRILDEAAAWLMRHLDHPDALAVARELDRIAPGWQGRRGLQQRSAQGGA